MSLLALWFRPKPDPEPAPHAGYFALHDRFGDEDETPVDKFDDWDRRLAQTEPDTARGPWFGRRRRWWIVRGVAALLALLILIVAWLAVTAPLSKSLQPIAAPQLTLLASDGTPIARSGAVIDKPVEVKKLPKHVVNAFIAIEDRRFYSHWGIDPRGMARAAWTGSTTRWMPPSSPTSMPRRRSISPAGTSLENPSTCRSVSSWAGEPM